MSQCEVIVNDVISSGAAYEKALIKYFNDIGNTFNMGILNFRIAHINKNKEKYGIALNKEMVAEGTYGHRKIVIKDVSSSIKEDKKVERITTNTLWNNKIKIKDMDNTYLFNTIKLLNSYAKDRSKYGINGFKTDVFEFKIEDWLAVMTKEFDNR